MPLRRHLHSSGRLQSHRRHGRRCRGPNLASVLAYVYRHGRADVAHVALGCDLDVSLPSLRSSYSTGGVPLSRPRSGPDDVLAPARDGFELGQAREVDDPQALLDEERSHTYRALSFPRRLVTLFAGPFANVLLAFVLLLVIFCGIGSPSPRRRDQRRRDRWPDFRGGPARTGDTIVAIDGTDIPRLAALDGHRRARSRARRLTSSTSVRGR